MSERVMLEYSAVIVECNNPKMVGHRSAITEDAAQRDYGTTAEQVARGWLVNLNATEGVKAALEYRQIFISRSAWQYVEGLD